MAKDTPFIFGAQYYRAPTPEPDCWPADLRRMAELGFNAVKFWVQWRWSHRAPEGFVFDDLDRLMDLAAEAGLGVTLNTIFDVAPLWLYELYPDARQVANDGHAVEPYTVGHRQIGGHPGPCYNHPGALRARRDFMAATLDHFRGHPALSMWDVWNEPELSFPQRTPDMAGLVCYCAHCREAFLGWLRAKYGLLEALNTVWGRCYEDWTQVELPRNPHTFTDFVDWREFHIDTMTGEARWRLALVAERDPDHVRYLHVVPNTMAPFNVVTCAADDFALADNCDVFAATMNGGPVMATQVISAARGRLVYNVESHVNHGCTSLHQRVLGLDDLLDDFLPQIGLGIRGFLFWQYRPEVLGFEAPAWGLVALDGSDRPVTRAAATFWETLRRHAAALLDCPALPAPVGIWKSRKNEIFHYAVHGTFQPLIESVETYLGALYWQSVPARFISGEMLAQGDLAGLKLLVLPSPYYLTQAEAVQLDAWVRAGGVALVEAHLGGYDGTTGRHSRVMPGCGLADAWGLREIETTSARYLSLAPPPSAGASAPDGGTAPELALTEDVKKALAALGPLGGEVFPLAWDDVALARLVPARGAEGAPAPSFPPGGAGDVPNRGGVPGPLWGADRFAILDGAGLTVLATFADRPVVVAKPVGAGAVIYAGTRLGQAARANPAAFAAFVRAVVARAGVAPPLGAVASAAPASSRRGDFPRAEETAQREGARRADDDPHVHVDLLRDREGTPRYLIVLNRDAAPRTLTLDLHATARGLFSGETWRLTGPTAVTVPPHFADLFVLA